MKRTLHMSFAFSAAVALALSACAAAAPEPTATLPPTATATAQPTNTPIPTATPTSTPTPAPTPIQITKKDNTVKVGQPAVLLFGWGATTQEQVQDFIDAVTVTMKIDGKPVEGDFKEYWGPISSSASGGYVAYWRYPLADNAVFATPGTYKVVVNRALGKSVFDGTTWLQEGTVLTFSLDVNIAP